MFYYSRDRAGAHPQAHLAGYSGILQADAYGGYSKLYLPDRRPGPITEAACWVHARRPFYAMADIEANARRRAQGKKPAVISPIALLLNRWPAFTFFLADVLHRIAGYPAHRIDELLPWNWKGASPAAHMLAA